MDGSVWGNELHNAECSWGFYAPLECDEQRTRCVLIQLLRSNGATMEQAYPLGIFRSPILGSW